MSKPLRIEKNSIADHLLNAMALEWRRETGQEDRCKEADKALLYASTHGYAEVVEFLLQKGANVNCRGINGYTPLMHATISCSLNTMKVLVNFGADLDTRNILHGRAIDCAKSDSKAAKFLLKEAPKIMPKSILSLYLLDFELGFGVINELFPDRFSEREIYYLI